MQSVIDYNITNQLLYIYLYIIFICVIFIDVYIIEMGNRYFKLEFCPKSSCVEKSIQSEKPEQILVSCRNFILCFMQLRSSCMVGGFRRGKLCCIWRKVSLEAFIWSFWKHLLLQNYRVIPRHFSSIYLGESLRWSLDVKIQISFLQTEHLIEFNCLHFQN